MCKTSHGNVVLPYNQSKDLRHLATSDFGIKESAHHLTWKNPILSCILFLYGL